MNVVDQLLKDAVEAGDAVGVSAVAVDANGTRYLGAAGFRDAQFRAPMRPDTIVRIASMTKAITSLAVMQQVERGALTLHAPIDEILPELRNPPVLEGVTDSGRPILRPAKRPITLHHLLTHTSGLAYPTWNRSLIDFRKAEPQARPIQGPDLRLSLPLVFNPGDRWEYGTNTDWAGFAIRNVTQRALGDAMQENIFSPLGMRDTAFNAVDVTRQSRAFRRDTKGGLIPIEESSIPAPAYQGGGGGLFSTASDYGKFLRALLGARGSELVSTKTLAQMRENHIGSLTAGTLPACETDRSNDVAMFPRTRPKWSLYGLINPQPVAGGRDAGSVCWGGLYNSYFWVDSNRGVAGAIFTQTLPFCDARILRLYARFEQLIYA